VTISGVVNAGQEAVIRLRVRGPGGFVAEVDAVIDTGYSGMIALPAALCMTLGLPQRAGVTTVLADGSSRRVASYRAEVEWGSGWRPVAITAVGGEALVGMGLLAGHELRVEVTVGGAVSIRPLEKG